MKPGWFLYLVSVAIFGSVFVPIVMVFLSRSSARRLFRRAMLLVLPAMAISCGGLISDGEVGFLGFWHGLLTAMVLLALSFGFGYGASRVKTSWLDGNQGAKPGVCPRDEW